MIEAMILGGYAAQDFLLPEIPAIWRVSGNIYLPNALLPASSGYPKG